MGFRTKIQQSKSKIAFTFLQKPTSDQIQQIIRLYQLAGWWTDTSDNSTFVRRMIAGSYCFIIATEGEAIIGMGRALSDGVSDAYIQDVTTAGEYQHRGIGSLIVKKLIARLQNDGLSWIGLIAESNSHAFYERLGFKLMPDAAPMVIEER